MISKEDILALAKLARIEISDADTDTFQRDISNILAYVAQVTDVSYEGERDDFIVRNIMREDIPYTASSTLSNTQQDIRDAFPEQRDGFNVVRKILNKDE